MIKQGTKTESIDNNKVQLLYQMIKGAQAGFPEPRIYSNGSEYFTSSEFSVAGTYYCSIELSTNINAIATITIFECCEQQGVWFEVCSFFCDLNGVLARGNSKWLPNDAEMDIVMDETGLRDCMEMWLETFYENEGKKDRY